MDTSYFLHDWSREKCSQESSKPNHCLFILKEVWCWGQDGRVSVTDGEGGCHGIERRQWLGLHGSQATALSS